MAIKPPKPETGAGQSGTDNRQLSRERIKRNLQIFSDAKISRHIREDRVSERDGDRAADRKTVKSVRQIHSVRCADDDGRKKQKREPAHIIDDGRFHERDVKRTRLYFEHGTSQKNSGDHDPEHDLEEQLPADTHTGGFFLCHFQVIVDETKRAEIERGKEREPDEAIGWPCP